MIKNYYRFPSTTPRRASFHGVDEMFAWTIFIFLLMGFALFCWIGSFYIFGHPEKATNYRLLMRLHKLEEPQRFGLTEAPRGEFLKPKKLLERFGSLNQRERRRFNDRLLANFLRNYHQTHDLTPYVTETYRVLAAFPLTKKHFFYPGMCALLQSVDQPELLLEQVFPIEKDKFLSKLAAANEVGFSNASIRSVQKVLGETNIGTTEPFDTKIDIQKSAGEITALEKALTTGQEIKFEKPLDLSAILHVEKLSDGRLKLTTISLLYGSYGPTSSGPILFSLAPPTHLRVEAGLPLLSPQDLISAEKEYAAYRTKMGFSNQEGKQEAVQPNSSFILQIVSSKITSSAKKSFSKKIPRAEKALSVLSPTAKEATPAVNPKVTNLSHQSVLAPTASLAPIPVAPIATTDTSSLTISNNLLSSTNSAMNSSSLWSTYDPGKIPRGRFATPPQFSDLAEKGLAGERLYLQGSFAVTASGKERSVLRYQSNNSSLTPDQIAKMRIIVSYPAGVAPPAEGTSVERNQDRPLMITDVKKGNDGILNVYVREIIK